MGRTTVARSIKKISLSTMRDFYPIFDLPDMSEAVDFHIALKEDLDGFMDSSQLSTQIDAFERLTPEEQASFIAKQVEHWSLINQPVIFRTRWGLRDRTRKLKPWLYEFFRRTEETKGFRAIYISERRLPDEEIEETPSVAQFPVGELTKTDIQVLLSNIIEPRYFNARKAESLAEMIGGHPATAHYSALLINSGRNVDTLTANPDPIMAFQAKTLTAIFGDSLINDTQRKIIALLGVFPKLSFRMLAIVLEVPKTTLAEEVWALIDFSLLQSVDSEYYGCPDIVAAHARRNLAEVYEPLLGEVKEKIQADIDAGQADSQLISALLIACMETSGAIPQKLTGLLTSSSLLSIVRSLFDRAISKRGNNKQEFLRIYSVSKLAMSMQVSEDAVEQILFTGGDSAIRAGEFPSDIIDFMERNALPAVYYLRGSHAFHVEKKHGYCNNEFEISPRNQAF